MDMTELPRGAQFALKRARANGFTVHATPGKATVPGKRKVLLWTEDGQPATTATGRQRSTMEPFERKVTSWGVHVRGHGQGQFGMWVDDAFAWGMAWRADRADIPRDLDAAALGTVIDLAQLRSQAIDRARAALDSNIHGG